VTVSQAAKNRRDRAAAARDAANADERRRERLVRVVGAVTVVAVVVGIIGVALIARGSSDGDSALAAPTADPNAAVPQSVLPADDEYRYGVPYGTATPDAPVLEVWEDVQCPACAAVEQANGEGLAALADAGRIQLIWRPATFLDRANLGADPAVANSSTRATAAWGCAIDAGVTREFHDLLYANQPVEGQGWTDEQLTGLGAEAGLSGAALDEFTQCVADGTYLGWAANSGAAFQEDGIAGTPYALLNGVEVPTELLVDQAALEQLVDAAAAAGSGDPESAPSPAAS
jgi:protein-disulfide isomerase